MTVRFSPWKLAQAATSPIGELSCGLLFERSLADPIPPADNRLLASIRLADESDLDAVCALYAGDPWLWLGRNPQDRSARARYVDRLRRGELCYIATVEGRIAHVNWTCFSWGDALPEQPIMLQPGEIYTTDAFTPEPFRGKGLHALVLGTMLRDARERGLRHAYTLGQLDRPDALKGLNALGWRNCGRVIYFLPRGRAKALFLSRRGTTEPLFRPR